jgi:chromosome segregation ATPase
MAEPFDDTVTLRILNFQLEQQKEELKQIREALKQIAEAFNKLALLEEKHNTIQSFAGRMSDRIDGFEDRIREIEKQQPIDQLVGKWVIGGVVGVVGLVAAAAFSFIFGKAS